MGRLGWMGCGLLVAVWLTSGCAVTSKSVREEAGPPIPFRDLQADPAAYSGRTVILGGYILEVRNTNDGTTLVVLQSPLGAGEEPGRREASEGRFLALQKAFLDPEVYRKDRKVTIAGTLTGAARETVDERPYEYPTLAIREIHLWEEERAYPAPYPYYYDPFYDPWWPYYRPWRPYRYPYW